MARLCYQVWHKSRTTPQNAGPFLQPYQEQNVTLSLISAMVSEFIGALHLCRTFLGFAAVVAWCKSDFLAAESSADYIWSSLSACWSFVFLRPCKELTLLPVTCRRSKVFYSSNKEITLDEVIFSNCIRKIESQLPWPGSSLGHQQSRGCRHLHCTSKERCKGTVFSLSTWALSAGATGRSLSIFWELQGCSLTPWTLLLSSKSRLCGFCHLWKSLFGKDNNAETPTFLVSVLRISTLLQNLLISENFPMLFSAVSVCTLTSKLPMYNFLW